MRISNTSFCAEIKYHDIFSSFFLRSSVCLLFKAITELTVARRTDWPRTSRNTTFSLNEKTYLLRLSYDTCKLNSKFESGLFWYCTLFALYSTLTLWTLLAHTYRANRTRKPPGSHWSFMPYSWKTLVSTISPVTFRTTRTRRSRNARKAYIRINLSVVLVSESQRLTVFLNVFYISIGYIIIYLENLDYQYLPEYQDHLEWNNTSIKRK